MPTATIAKPARREKRATTPPAWTASPASARCRRRKRNRNTSPPNQTEAASTWTMSEVYTSHRGAVTVVWPANANPIAAAAPPTTAATRVAVVRVFHNTAVVATARPSNTVTVCAPTPSASTWLSTPSWVMDPSPSPVASAGRDRHLHEHADRTDDCGPQHDLGEPPSIRPTVVHDREEHGAARGDERSGVADAAGDVARDVPLLVAAGVEQRRHEAGAGCGPVADGERERAVHGMRVGGDHPPRHDVAAVPDRVQSDRRRVVAGARRHRRRRDGLGR